MGKTYYETEATKRSLETRSCFCIGPQNGEPLCPCMMRGVKKKNGRWVKPEQDLGPVYEEFDKNE